MEVRKDLGAEMQQDFNQMGPPKQKRKRIRNWTAEDRAVHREFEKSRREAFSERLNVSQELVEVFFQF